MKERDAPVPKEPNVLIVSTKFDPHVDFLIPKLREKNIPFVRFNTEDFPTRASLTILFEGVVDTETLKVPPGIEISNSEITAIWYRRPAAFEFPSQFSPAAHVFADRETRATIAGLWQLLDAIWVNHPAKNRVAEIKLHQLKTAARLGLDIPRTLVTNDPEEARKFFTHCEGKIIIKTLSGGLVEEGPSSTAIFTNKVEQTDLDNITSIQYTPTLFQEYVPKEVELRVTVVGKKVFTAEIHSQALESTRDDWRRPGTLKLAHAVHQLPLDVEKRCKELIGFFGLNFGAIDMILTPDGRYVFLEINPNGQWAWIEDLTGMPISEAMADLLSGKQ